MVHAKQEWAQNDYHEESAAGPAFLFADVPVCGVAFWLSYSLISLEWKDGFLMEVAIVMSG